MNIVILAGGRGTRLEEETRGLIPKPLVQVGTVPLIEHILRFYQSQLAPAGEAPTFYVAAGFKHTALIEWAAKRPSDGATIWVVNTGEDTQTGGRLMHLKRYLQAEPFMLTYGDGLTDLNLLALLDFHRREVKAQDACVTLTAVHPPNRFGYMDVDEDGLAVDFAEKPSDRGSWVNGGFYVVESSVFDIIPNDNCIFEQDVLPALSAQRRLACFRHTGWWQCVDHPRELKALNDMWADGKAPWQRWGKEVQK